MNLFPVFARELRSEIESHRLRKERLMAGLIAGAILVVLIFAERWIGGINLRRLFSFFPIMGVVPFMLVIIGLSRAGNLLSMERRDGILPLLVLTRLTGHDIVLGKLLQALVVEVSTFLAILPALVLPLIALGFQFGELCMIALGCLNVMFFALAFGLLASLFGDGPKAASWSLVLLLPLLAYSSPFGMFLPAGRVRECLAALQWLNPCDALAHVQTAAGGFRPSAYWSSLLVSHAVAWCLIGLAGGFLPSACRWQAGLNAGSHRKKRWRLWSTRARHRSPLLRTRLLDRNPILWLTSRDRWPTAQVWLWLTISGAGWVWLVAWVGRTVGVPLYFVLALAAAAIWHMTLLVLIPSEASRRLVEDRLSGAMEMVLCTPLGVKQIVHGQWRSLGRRYLLPIIVVMLVEAALMTAGYVTYGFGGMLEPEDRGLWLFTWLTGILVLPLWLTALCWVAMRRSLFARNVGEAGGVAVVQVLAVPGFALWTIYALTQWAGWNPEAWWTAIPLAVLLLAMLVAFTWRARRIVLANLRQAAASRYFADPSTDRRSKLRIPSSWSVRKRSFSTP